ncbi:MAG: hypothetical protein RLZZ360_735 [Candidatus Parcubacteria bacterium]|jgi:hypothetical protein
MFNTSAPRITVRFVALLTAVSLVLSAFPAAFFVANAQTLPIDEPVSEEEKITVCHAAGQSGNYTATEVALSAVIGGHDDHQYDIIPPFGDFSGQNWNDDTEAIWENNCMTPEEDVEESATLIADKIVCENESSLPNFGSSTENPDITAEFAEAWVAEHKDDCRFVKGWQFQWAPYGSTGNPGDDVVGEVGSPWTTFSYSTSIPESAFETGVWVREVLQDGYIPFTYNPEKTNSNPVSAELYCHQDVLNFDNIDYVGGIEDKGSYYCVAWNVLAEEPEPTYTIDGYKYFCDLEEDGDYEYWDCEEGLDGWTITATNGTTSTTTVTDQAGHYSFELPAGNWTVSEEDRLNWEQIYVWQNDVAVDTTTCSLALGMVGSTTMQRSVANTCVFGNTQFEGPLYTVSGYKWNDTDADGLWDEGEIAIPGWTITVTDGEISTSTVTDEDGFYLFSVPMGEWTVSEEMREGWTQTGVLMNEESIKGSVCTFDITESMVLGHGDARVAWYNFTCDFGNKQNQVIEEDPEEPKQGGSSSGTRTKKKPQGQVLGATTQCGLWLEDYMQKATTNDTYQVLKLQVFLTLQGYATPLTGIFDDTTEANVKLFQAKYADTVIKPWFEKGIVPHNRPTGFVYKTTRWKINDIMCPGIEPYPSFEGENLNTNVLINR